MLDASSPQDSSRTDSASAPAVCGCPELRRHPVRHPDEYNIPLPESLRQCILNVPPGLGQSCPTDPEALLVAAFDFGFQLHEGQFRASGDPCRLCIFDCFIYHLDVISIASNVQGFFCLTSPCRNYRYAVMDTANPASPTILSHSNLCTCTDLNIPQNMDSIAGCLVAQKAPLQHVLKQECPQCKDKRYLN